MFASKRLSKELMKMKEHLPPGISIVKSENLEEWQMDIKVLDDNPLYQNETYRLKFTFGSKYPIEPPEVQFIECKSASAPSQPQPQPPSTQPQEDMRRPIPIHPHIYSNGIICLDLLSSAGWSPVQTVESVCMSIQSMLTANSRNERPPGDSDFVSYNRRRPRDINFLYDDDNV
ncbi:ubiquitin-conjugating enzyme/RWD-like protein [Aspergillus karnatakaensis]|uniref:ubiquitin-conjugating enzyme E2 n=1 Tax=Aspergillus karnatakaensis TaxID=1810916 RepID=UPI003CCD82F8